MSRECGKLNDSSSHSNYCQGASSKEPGLHLLGGQQEQDNCGHTRWFAGFKQDVA